MRLVPVCCVECGRTVRRDIRASLCWPCRKKRHQRRTALYVKARRVKDPAYDAWHRDRYNRYAREATRRSWPVRCVMCGELIECLRGRRRPDAICRRCARAHRAAAR